jgi:putative transposase
MRCKKEEFVEGAVFHIYNKTQKGKNLFYDRDDYIYLLRKFNDNYKRISCEVYAYCLMPNHFHFCLKQTSTIELFKPLNKIFISYALHYNNKYKIKGRLFQSKLQHRKVEKENYLISLCQYIHFNPVKANLVDKIEDWEFSNYLEYTNRRDGKLFSHELIKIFPYDFVDYEKRIKDYEKYIDDQQFQYLLID